MHRRFVISYLALLAASHLVRLLTPSSPDAAGFAYDEIPASATTAPTLVLLHGSPMRAGDWQPLVDELGNDFRIIIPHLYGSGDSEPDLSDYSPAAAAGRVSDLLAKLDIPNAHLVGFSTGGTTALYLAAENPEKVESLTLLAPMAIEALELVGDGTLNHTVYWAQKFYIWCGLNLLPHFGLLDKAPADRNYGRHYYDSDPRKLAPLLAKVVAPTQILHGGSDLIRPSASSRELARRLPHAALELLDGGHEAPLQQAEKVAATLRDQIANPSPDRAAASPERVAASAEPFRYARYRDDLRARVTLMVVLLAIATLISEDITCITAGILASRGMLGLFPATLGCFLGILIGDVGLYLLGRVAGRRALRIPPMKWLVKEEEIETSERFFHRYGAILVIATRWLPGMRIPTYVAAGMLKLKFRVFIFYFFIAAAVWTPLLVGFSTLVGNTLLGWLAKVEDFAPLILLAVLLTVWLGAKFVMKRATRAFESRAGQ